MVTLAENKKHIIIKRDGREEPYNEEKLKKVIMWATNNSKILTEKILKNLNIKINDKMRITVLYDELISTVVNMISPLYPDFQFIAGKLYLMKIYKETWGLKKVENYPHLKEFLDEGLKSKLYDIDFINDFTEEELEEINSYIKAERDLLYTYKGLVIMYDKYCKKYKGKKSELPQITYMVAAMFSFYKDHSKDRLKLIKETYDMLSTKKVTFATPRLMNSGIVNCQLASCVLNTVADDTWSLNQTDGNAALYSKFAGGIAYDASYIRASGSRIGVGKGNSNGPVPFIKRLEQTISSFDQSGCVYSLANIPIIKSVELSNGCTIELITEKPKIEKYYISKDIIDYVKSISFEVKTQRIYLSKKDVEDIILNWMTVKDIKIIQKNINPNVNRTFIKKYINPKINNIDIKNLPTFKDLKEFPDYAINKEGVIINKRYCNIMVRYLNKKNYICVTLKKSQKRVHRLLYKTFIDENLPDDLSIDHIDGNKQNNNLSNLQVLTLGENNLKRLNYKNNRELLSLKTRVLRHLKFGYELNGKRTIGKEIEITKINEKIINILETKTGMFVRSFNKNTKQIEYKEIEETFRFDIPIEEQNYLKFKNNTEFVTSNEHPIFYLDKDSNVKYKATIDMKIGDLGIDGNGNVSELLVNKKSEIKYEFADLTVKDNNNYFVSSPENPNDFILIHNTRKGSAVVSFCWWHLDVQDLLMLKDAGGAEDNRARKLQYAIKINEEFIKRVEKDENITLFCPSQTPLLLESFGEEFSNNYKMYEEKGGIRKKTIKARDLAYLILKVRKETGNLYITFIDNINKQNVRNVFVGSSNLCMEICIPSLPSKKLETRIVEDFETGKIKIIEEKESGEIGICNLASINLVEWVKLTDTQKRKLTYTLLRGMDNTLDTQFYPVAEGKVSNLRNRPIGIGVLNYANLLAQNKIKFTDDEALEFTNLLFDDLYYHIYKSSVELAKERGAYKTFKNDKWAKGLTPFHLSKLDAKKLKISSNKEKWDELGKEIKENYIRFSLHGAIAPTACQITSNTIQVNNKEITLKDYLIDNGVDVESVEKTETQMWVDLKDKATVSTRFGEKEVERVFYNGKQKIRYITFEDGKTYGFTLNHPLYVKGKGWVEVKDLQEGDDIENPFEGK